ncbi:MAG: FimV/HubP family polar landmark protein, partial [Pigmentiphaga sp.]
MPFQQNSRLASRRTGLKVSGTVIVMLGVLAGGLAQAAEWSRARILSGVGQPLSVEIPVRDLPAGLLPASISATVDAGHATDAGLADRQAMPVSATLLPRADGADGAILVLTSSQAVPRGVVDLALQLDLPSGTERRRIVLLLAPAKGANITPVRLASTEPAGSIRVARGDTLGAIAAQLRRQAGTDSGTLEQWLAALFETNPAAFIQGNLHLVRAGATLAVPSIDAVRAIDPATARRLVAAHLRDFTALRGKVARPAPMAAVPAPATEPAASRGAVAIPAPAPAPAQNRDSLRLSSLLPGNGTAHAATRDSQAVIDQLRDERAATQKALEDARSRVGELESTVQEMEKLLGLQNEALARLQRQGSSSPRSAGSAIAPGTANGAGRDAPAAAAGVADRLADGAIGSAEGLNGTGGAVAAAPDAGMAGRAASGAAASSAGATGAGRTPATDSATTAGAPPPAMAQSLQPDNAQPANGGATPAAAAVPSVGGNAAASGAMASSPAGAGVLGSSTDTATSASAGSRAAVTPASAG